MTEKLQKILSRAGIASRRALEQMIEENMENDLHLASARLKILI